MKHIVLFSGGLASSYVAHLVLQEQKKEDVILLHTPTYSENHDADTFRHQVARYLNHPITEWGDGRNIWELIEDNNCIPGHFIPFCTQQLKTKMKEQFYKQLNDDYIEYVGFGAEEWKRVQRSYARAESKGRKVSFPLFEQKITSEEVRRVITEEWELKLPKAYEDLSHNNCIPCFKAGKASWKVYWEKYPEAFWKASEYEEKIGYTVFKDKSLKELAQEFEDKKEANEAQVSVFEIPCECWD